MPVNSQSYIKINVDPSSTFQTITGFGGSLAYYENWLTAHPNKGQIYEALFGELSLDILRLRNAHEYDPGMINRAKEFVQAAEKARGNPISVLSTSWGPPARLKSNNDRNNGGTIRYSVNNGVVEFDYRGFAGWWSSSLDEYNANGIYPDYISIQNEPDWTASYESCRLNPRETITSADTIAGYDKALIAVYDTIQSRSHIPYLLGPETIGIGYNAVENYVGALDLSKIHGIAHHLYHGANEDNPFSSSLFKKVGDYHLEIPHFQTEYSRAGWWSVAGLLHMSLSVENVVAYLYWDLIWVDGGGLVSLDFPWDRSRWTDPLKGYTKTKDFYVFKQYSAFIHPGWKRISANLSGGNSVVSAYMSPDEDSATIVLINRSEAEEILYKVDIGGYTVRSAELFLTSENENCQFFGDVTDRLLSISPKSIVSVSLNITKSETDIAVDSIILNMDSDSINSYFGTLQLQAEVLPVEASDKTLLWQVIENDHIASVSQDGLLQAMGTGEGTVKVKVSATDGSGVYREVLVRLTNQVAVTAIVIENEDPVIIIPGGSLQLEATVIPENASDKTLEWSIIEGQGLAQVDQNGLVTATGQKDGSVIVRASSMVNMEIYSEVSIRIQNQNVSLHEIREDEFRIWYSNGLLNYYFESPVRGARIAVFRIDGALIVKKEISEFNHRGEILVGQISKGIYLVEISGDSKGRKYFRKIIISN
jgi:glucuronoarabinoxylan endo-1,4-beta-xylanase